MRAELDEFYSYVEAPQTGENRAAWEEWCSLTRELSSASNQGAEGGTGAEKERAAAEEEDAPAGAPGELAAGGGALGLGLGLDTGAGQAQPESKNGAKKGAVLGGEFAAIPARLITHCWRRHLRCAKLRIF